MNHLTKFEVKEQRRAHVKFGKNIYMHQLSFSCDSWFIAISQKVISCSYSVCFYISLSKPKKGISISQTRDLRLRHLNFRL